MRYLQFGVTMYDTATATLGFTLLVPMFRHEAYLIGMRGRWCTSGPTGRCSQAHTPTC